jgi:hypothetical protein
MRREFNCEEFLSGQTQKGRKSFMNKAPLGEFKALAFPLRTSRSESEEERNGCLVHDIEEIQNLCRNILINVTMRTTIVDLPDANLLTSLGLFGPSDLSHPRNPFQDCLDPKQIGPHISDARSAKAPSPPHTEDRTSGLGQRSGLIAGSGLKAWPEHSKGQNYAAEDNVTCSAPPEQSLYSAEHKDHNDEIY